MTDWTEIPNTVFEVGKPARAVDMRALRDNITALSEGSPGAPKIATRALGLSQASGSTPLTMKGLATVSRLLVVARAAAISASESTATAAVRMRRSSDGGGSWEGWSAITLMASARAGNNTVCFTDSRIINMDGYNAIQFELDGRGSGYVSAVGIVGV